MTDDLLHYSQLFNIINSQQYFLVHYWYPYQTSTLFDQLPKGRYTVRVRDANNCINFDSNVVLTDFDTAFLLVKIFLDSDVSVL
mgnify:CR=1 FL=1